jgi:hypothetical protein
MRQGVLSLLQVNPRRRETGVRLARGCAGGQLLRHGGHMLIRQREVTTERFHQRQLTHAVGPGAAVARRIGCSVGSASQPEGGLVQIAPADLEGGEVGIEDHGEPTHGTLSVGRQPRQQVFNLGRHRGGGGAPAPESGRGQLCEQHAEPGAGGLVPFWDRLGAERRQRGPGARGRQDFSVQLQTDQRQRYREAGGERRNAGGRIAVRRWGGRRDGWGHGNPPLSRDDIHPRPNRVRSRHPAAISPG